MCAAAAVRAGVRLAVAKAPRSLVGLGENSLTSMVVAVGSVALCARPQTAAQSFQKSRNRSGETSLYLTVCWMFLWPIVGGEAGLHRWTGRRAGRGDHLLTGAVTHNGGSKRGRKMHGSMHVSGASSW